MSAMAAAGIFIERPQHPLNLMGAMSEEEQGSISPNFVSAENFLDTLLYSQNGNRHKFILVL
jgi:hypothetical protein